MEDQQLLRYQRHIMLPECGIEGQEKLTAAHVAIIGLGGLGSPAALYLAAAGVGKLTLVDFDQVELSNLQRQILHNTEALGKNKTQSAQTALSKINPDISLHCVDTKIDDSTLSDIINDCDVVIDATDNFASRYAINRCCKKNKTPLVSGAAIRMEGQISVFDFRDPNSPCYSCLYPATGDINEEQLCSENGILGPVVGTIGCLQATEAIKLITGIGQLLTGTLLLFDAARMEWRRMNFKRDPRCPVCGKPAE